GSRMPPRGLVVPAAVYEQVEMQLPLHGACRIAMVIMFQGAIVARIERSEIRDRAPGFAALNPGYKSAIADSRMIAPAKLSRDTVRGRRGFRDCGRVRTDQCRGALPACHARAGCNHSIRSVD